jgi:hypothetical protein
MRIVILALLATTQIPSAFGTCVLTAYLSVRVDPGPAKGAIHEKILLLSASYYPVKSLLI